MIKNLFDIKCVHVKYIPCLQSYPFFFMGKPLVSFFHVFIGMFYMLISRYSYWLIRYIKESRALWSFKDESGLHGHLF